MNETLNNFLLARNKFMPGMYLRQSRFIYSACGPFIWRIQKFKETGNSRHIYQSKLDKACFQHDMASGYFRDLPRRASSDK